MTLVRKRRGSKDRQIHTIGIREAKFSELFCSASKKVTYDWMTQCFLFFYFEIISDLQKVAERYIFHPHYETVNILEPFENKSYA